MTDTCDELSTRHARTVDWESADQINILDSFDGPGNIAMRGAFHFGECENVKREKSTVRAEFAGFHVDMIFPEDFDIEIHYGSQKPFIGWRSGVYGSWQPSYCVVFSRFLRKNDHYKIRLRIIEK